MSAKQKSILHLLLLCCIMPYVSAQEVYKLWEGMEKPYYIENTLKEYEDEAFGTRVVYNVTEPTLTVYKAKGENSGKAVIIIPGGGYGLVAIYHEGFDLAKVLSDQGITAAVLKYRLPNPASSLKPQMVPITDARRAMKILRSMKERYEFRSEGLGVLGFSAGSHLATVASLWKSDDPDENPAFSALIYGVTDFSGENLTWLQESLYYRELTDDEAAKNQLLNLVTENTPPAFLVHAYDDDVCNVKESTLYADKLREHNIPVEMHLFPSGGHGFGMGREEDGTDQWIGLFINWLDRK